jgi:hypothetical protein
MARQANVPVVPAASVDSPQGGTTGVLFIDSNDSKLKLRFPDGTLSVATVVANELTFPKA